MMAEMIPATGHELVDKLRALQVTAGSLIEEDERVRRVGLGAKLLGAGSLIGANLSISAGETLLASPEKTARLKRSEIFGPVQTLRYMVINDLRIDSLTLDFRVSDVVGVYGSQDDQLEEIFTMDELQTARLSVPVLSIRSCEGL